MAVTVADPVVPPLQSTGEAAAVAVSCGGCVIVVLAVEVQPLASVTVTTYDPAVRPVGLAPEPDGVQLYV